MHPKISHNVRLLVHIAFLYNQSLVIKWFGGDAILWIDFHDWFSWLHRVYRKESTDHCWWFNRCTFQKSKPTVVNSFPVNCATVRRPPSLAIITILSFNRLFLGLPRQILGITDYRFCMEGIKSKVLNAWFFFQFDKIASLISGLLNVRKKYFKS